MKTQLNMLIMRFPQFLVISFLSFILISTHVHGQIQQPDIRVDSGILNLTAKEIFLEDILQELSDLTGIVFEMQVPVSRPITIQLRNVPLVEGLRRILNPENCIIEYGQSSAAGQNQIKKVFVYGTGQPSTVRPQRGILPIAGHNIPNETDPDIEQTLADYAELFKDPDPELRQEAVSDMMGDYGEEALPYLARLLVDDDSEEVRITAAMEIGNLDSRQGIVPLAKGLNDPSEDVRQAVIEALQVIGGTEIIPALEKALEDESDDIRTQAQYLIDELKDQQQN